MGAWGYGPLEDDTAMDWIGSFSPSPSMDSVIEAIQSALNVDFIDDYCGPHALAACEVLAAVNGQPTKQLPEEVKEWAVSQTATQELKASAKSLIAKIYEESELREIWDDSGEKAVENWKVALDDLQKRLA